VYLTFSNDSEVRVMLCSSLLDKRHCTSCMSRTWQRNEPIECTKRVIRIYISGYVYDLIT
jgi:hypothetical protein